MKTKSAKLLPMATLRKRLEITSSKLADAEEKLRLAEQDLLTVAAGHFDKRGKNMKAPSYYTTLLFATLLGFVGADRFYTGNWFLGILKFLTAGAGGIWWAVDIILLLMGTYEDGDGSTIIGNAQDEKIEAKLGFSLRIK